MDDATTAIAQPALSPAQAYQQALQMTLQLAVDRHQAGGMQEAAQLYRAILQGESAHPQANHNLGILLLQTGEAEAALPHLEAALAVKPESERYWLSYLDALIQTGQSGLARERLAFAREHGLEGDAAEALADLLIVIPLARVAPGAKQKLVA